MTSWQPAGAAAEATGAPEAEPPVLDAAPAAPEAALAAPIGISLDATGVEADVAATKPKGNRGKRELSDGMMDTAPKKDKKPKKVYEAGGIIVCDGKVVLRLTDAQNWIFPKGKLKEHEAPVDAAIREAVEETGLAVEVIGDAGEFMMKDEGKKRRFVFYLMRATDTTWDWEHHEGRDTFLMDPERVGSLVRKKYLKLWEACEERVRQLAEGAVGDGPPPPAAPEAAASSARTP